MHVFEEIYSKDLHAEDIFASTVCLDILQPIIFLFFLFHKSESSIIIPHFFYAIESRG